MELEDTLRAALQADAAELVPVGPGPADARRHAFRRKRRMQSGVVVASAAALVGGTLGFIETRSPGHGSGPRVTTTGESLIPTSDLEWRTVDGTVLVNGPEFTSSSGVTYAVSTAPGSKPNANSWTDPQELYSTRDGINWTHASLGSAPWVVDLAESNGVLYAVGTAPGSANSVDYQVSTSSDGGARWSVTPLPVDFTAPHASVPLTTSRSVHIARGAHTTVAMAKASYWPDVTKVIGDGTAYNVTPSGVQILEAPSCNKRTATTAAPGTPNTLDPCKFGVKSTRPWSDFGISDPAALSQQQVLVCDDGGSWSTIDLPTDSGSWVQDLTATTHGFLMVKQLTIPDPTVGSRSEVQLWSSSDGRSWTQMGGVPKFESAAVSGDRIIGVASATGVIYTSADAGATWASTENVGSLLPAGTEVQANMVSAYAGPLGFAAVVMSGSPDKPGRSYLLNSNGGTAWNVTDLTAVGAPAKSYISSVSVGKDHIDVSYSVDTGTLPDGSVASQKLVELVGTPKA